MVIRWAQANNLRGLTPDRLSLFVPLPLPLALSLRPDAPSNLAQLIACRRRGLPAITHGSAAPDCGPGAHEPCFRLPAWMFLPGKY